MIVCMYIIAMTMMIILTKIMVITTMLLSTIINENGNTDNDHV